MNKNDAATFPLVASVALFSLYAAFKYFNEDVVKKLIFFYLVVVASAAMAGCINIVMENYFPKKILSIDIKKGLSFNNHLSLVIKFKLEVRLCDLISYAIAFGFGIVMYIL